MHRFAVAALLAVIGCLAHSASQPSPLAQQFDVVIRGGMVYDGTGAAGRRVDVAIRGDRIAGVGELASAPASTVIDASGLAVAPGFINMLSWSTESLIVDGRSQSEIRQGVTTQIMGEGWSMGPLNDAMKKRAAEQRRHQVRHRVDHARRVPAVTSRSAASRRTSPRSSARPPFASTSSVSRTSSRRRKQLEQMRELVRQEMEDGALGHRLVADLCRPPSTRRPRS